MLLNSPSTFPCVFWHLSLRRSPTSGNQLFYSNEESSSGWECWMQWNCNRETWSAKTENIEFFQWFHRKAQTHVAARVDHCKVVVNVAEHAVDLRQYLIVVLQMWLGARETINWKLRQLSAFKERRSLAICREILERRLSLISKKPQKNIFLPSQTIVKRFLAIQQNIAVCSRKPRDCLEVKWSSSSSPGSSHSSRQWKCHFHQGAVL